MKLIIEYLPIGDLTPYERNAKIHTPEQIEQIMNSIREFGMNDPIGVWGKENIIVEGHGRLEACKRLGYEDVPVIRLDDLTDEQRRAYTLVHNQTTMTTGFDLDILKEELKKISIDMEDFGFEDINAEDFDIKDDDYSFDEEEEQETPARSKRGEIYQLGNHRLMCGDSTDEENVDALMDGKTADLIVTDPPYNVNVSNSQGMTIENDNLTEADFAEFINTAFGLMSDRLKKGGAFYIWYGDSESNTFRTACENTGLQVKQCLIWVKNHFTLGRQDYQWRHEPCLYGWKQGEGHFFIYDRTQDTVIDKTPNFDDLSGEEAIAILKKIYERPSTILYEDKPNLNALHPTMKPIPLIAKLINNFSEKGEYVLDPFGGSGTTLIACEHLNRRCFMMEYEPKYVDAIIDRWETLTGKKAIKIRGE